MTLHKLIVLSMLAVTTVLALLYVSTFPSRAEDGANRAWPAQLLESGSPSPQPASGTTAPDDRRFDAQMLKHLA